MDNALELNKVITEANKISEEYKYKRLGNKEDCGLQINSNIDLDSILNSFSDLKDSIYKEISKQLLIIVAIAIAIISSVSFIWTTGNEIKTKSNLELAIMFILCLVLTGVAFLIYLDFDAYEPNIIKFFKKLNTKFENLKKLSNLENQQYTEELRKETLYRLLYNLLNNEKNYKFIKEYLYDKNLLNDNTLRLYNFIFNSQISNIRGFSIDLNEYKICIEKLTADNTKRIEFHKLHKIDIVDSSDSDFEHMISSDLVALLTITNTKTIFKILYTILQNKDIKDVGIIRVTGINEIDI